MTTIVLRQSKLEPLTINEVDANFQNLNDDKTENSAAAITGGTINGVTIGASSAGAGTFTTLTTSSDITTTDTSFTFGYTGTNTSTINIWTGTVGSGNTKTLNIGTGGASGSTTDLYLGSANGGTVTVNNDLVISGTVSSSTTPSGNNDLTNKIYVDSEINKLIGLAVALG
jgi:hypothetical protein